MSSQPRNGSDHESPPTYDGSYYMIVSRVIDAVRAEKGGKSKVAAATRQLKHLATHTRVRISALSLAKKILVALLLAGVGGAVVIGVYAGRKGKDADSLRAEIKALMSDGKLASAQKKFLSLRALVGDLGDKDKSEIDIPLRTRVASAVAAKKKELSAHKRAGRFDQALRCVDELEAMDTDPGYVLFTRAEIFRAANRRSEARATYAQYIRMFPNNGLTDDALFWQALSSKDDNDVEEARRLLKELIEKFPRSNFLVSGKRLLADLEAVPTAP